MKKNTSGKLSILLALSLILSCNISAFALEGDAEALNGEQKDNALVEYSEETEGSTQEDGPEEPGHVHDFGEWTVTVEPTYISEGEKVRTCRDEACQEQETEVVPRKTAYRKWVSVDGKKYYLDSLGKISTGWHKIRSSNSSKAAIKWCYFNKDGVFLKSVKKTTRNKWISVDGTRYYFTKKCNPVEQGIPYYNYKYGTYVLVDISDQQMYFYKGGELKRQADVVTGMKGRSNTPTGTYKVTQKCRNIRLVGSTWNCKVQYWIAFIGHSYGLHDSSWRKDSDFNDHTTYTRDGSHGCVNMRLADVAWLYNNVKIGSYVLIRK